MLKRLLAFLLLSTLAAASNAATRPADASDLRVALEKLNVVGSALYVAAHPDDENTAMIAWMSKERLLRTGYLSMTRGDGGQNLLGDEKGELLGVIRTQELLAARRIDGGEQYFTRALDFGFSKNPEEALAFWGHDRVLADVVWNIRRFQPDVLITRFPTTGEGGHGHHTASAILAVEAFKAAGDASRFPEQLQYVTVWQPKRLFWNRFSWTPIKPDDGSVASSLRVDLGVYNPLLGRAYTEIAAESRSQHKSQGFGSAERRGSQINYYDLLAGEPLTGDLKTADLFQGINQTWTRYPGGEAVGKVLREAADTFDPQHPAKIIPLLLRANDLLDRLGASAAWSPKSNPWIAVKRNELLEVIRGCAGLAIDVSASAASVTQGGELPVSVTVVNRSDYPFTLSTVASRYANPSKGVGSRLAYNQPVKTDISIKVPDDMPISQPYWLQKPPLAGSYVVDDQRLIGLPENPAAIPIVVTLQDDQFHTIIFTVPAVFRWTDPVRGEQIRPLDVVPEVTANWRQRVVLFPDSHAKSVSVLLRNFRGAGDASARLDAPNGWSVAPAAAPIHFEAKGDETYATFTVTPPAGQTTAVLAARVELASGKSVGYGVIDIDYPHIPMQHVFTDTAAKLLRIDVARKGTNVGYIMGAGDQVPEALRQIGYDVTLLSDADLEAANFSRFDTIVTGVRAYNTRPHLHGAQPKLLQYVHDGGTLVVQYNNPNDLAVEVPGPYPFKLSGNRVTVEEAPITFLAPASPLLNVPNKITQNDFANWVQERGLYFTSDWDKQYETPIASHDPNDTDRPGGELFAHYGKGAFIYTSYAWFRQLPAGVPGAYRLFANMVSAGH